MQQGGGFIDGSSSDISQHFSRVVILALNTLEVHNRQPAKFAHGDGDVNIRYRVHGGGKNGDAEGYITYTEINAGLLRVNGGVSGYYGDFIEAVGTA